MNNFDKNEGSEKAGAEFEAGEEMILPDAEGQIDDIELRAGESGAARVDELAGLTEAGDPLRARAAEIVAQTEGELKKAGHEAKKQIGKIKKNNPKVKHGTRKFVPVRKFGPPVVPQKKKEEKKIILPSEKKAAEAAEKAAEEKRRLTEGIKKLEIYTAQMVAELREQGVPVDDDCRIDETYYTSVFDKGELMNDAQRVEEREEQFSQNRPAGGKEIPLGPVMEKFVTALLYKLFKDQFIICQSSRFDDIKNGIDTVIIDKKTGAVVGAFDAVVGDNKGQRVNQKDSKTFLKNYCKDGGTLKYGLDVEDDKTVLKSRNNVPVLYLDLSRDELIKGITRTDFTNTRIGEIEKNIMEGLLETIRYQIENVDMFKKPDQNLGLKQTFVKLNGAFQRKQVGI